MTWRNLRRERVISQVKKQVLFAYFRECGGMLIHILQITGHIVLMTAPHAHSFVEN
jgi:hypothetical protein